ncbi:GGDEF domain-containing protein [Agaribacterium sp. ZY112]|uniref:sensor domain-containing diguanylate cyclase n=1 Tax=Agaribacterium sp. ZY112 TaxID=3233574 RepID=UPI00352586D8
MDVSKRKLANRRRSVFLFPFICVLVATLTAAVSLEQVLRSWYLERTEQDMQQVLAITLNTIKRIGSDNYEIGVAVDSIGLATPKYHISIANLDAQLIGDSYLDENGLGLADNLKQAPEFQQALQRGEARLIRFNPVSAKEIFYLAKRFTIGQFNGVIRIGLAIDEYNKAVYELRWLLVMLALVGMLLMGILVSMFSRYINALMSKEQSTLESRVEERTRDILLLHRLTNMLAACQNLKEVQTVVEDIVPRIIGSLNCSISLVNSSRNLVEKKIDWSGNWPGEKVFNPQECWALRKGKPHFSHDELSSQICEHMGESEENTLCIPLVAHGNAIGLMHLILTGRAESLSNDMIFTIAEHLGLALANLNMQEKLRQQATRDPLTGLHNRRHFEEAIDKELSRSQRYHEPCALLMIDIDNFKSFNDTFGHDAGDYVLKAISLLLKEAVRSEDTLCRLGGEELAVLLPKANINDAIACADKLCRMVSRNHFQLHSTALGTVTISIGISVYPVHALSAEGLNKSADLALYEAKTKGRNRFEVAINNEEGEHSYCLVEVDEEKKQAKRSNS